MGEPLTNERSIEFTEELDAFIRSAEEGSKNVEDDQEAIATNKLDRVRAHTATSVLEKRDLLRAVRS